LEKVDEQYEYLSEAASEGDNEKTLEKQKEQNSDSEVKAVFNKLE
jgi:hypothetical protein